MKNKQVDQSIIKFAGFQGVVTLSIAAVWCALHSADAALSALLAGLIVLIASLFFAKKCFQFQGAKQAKKILNAFYKGEAFKILFVILMLGMVFQWGNLEAAPFFLTFIMVQFTNWLTPFFFR